MVYWDGNWRTTINLFESIKEHWIASGLSVAGILSAVSASIKSVKWFRNRSDGKVLSIIEEASRQARLEHPGMNIALLPIKIADIASELKRNQETVYKSLRRLEARGKVIEVRKGEWCLGNRTQKEILDEQWSGRGGSGGRFNVDRFNR